MHIHSRMMLVAFCVASLLALLLVAALLYRLSVPPNAEQLNLVAPTICWALFGTIVSWFVLAHALWRTCSGPVKAGITRSRIPGSLLCTILACALIALGTFAGAAASLATIAILELLEDPTFINLVTVTANGLVIAFYVFVSINVRHPLTAVLISRYS